MACLDELTILALIEGRLVAAATEAAETHVDACPVCRELLAEVARTDETALTLRSAAGFEPGEVVGRFLVLLRVGTGGMGEVYAAWDPELDRRVALKVVSDERARDGKAQRDLVREAKASASISHPNVITVYDVGELDGRLYLAMEFMDGGTLAGWLHRPPRPAWRRVLERFVAAGEGLAAAHRAGLIHRDFKPDNVLLGAGDRVCVTDFGLARAHEPTQSSPTGDTTVVSLRTRAAGTPAYMAPEQLRGDEITVRADQFGFCVALWEGLFAIRPFAGDSARALLAATEAGTLREGSVGDVPNAIRRVIARGLSLDPAQRYASVDELLEALRRAAKPSRLVLWAGLASLSALALGAAAVVVDRGPSCPYARAKWEDGWGVDDRAALRRGFEATGASYASSTFDRFEQRMDDHVAAWLTAYHDACIAAQRTSEDLDASPSAICLEGQRAQALHLLEALAEPDRSRVQKALSEALRLPKPRECEERVAAGIVGDDEAVEAVVAQTENARRLDRMGRDEEASALLDDAEQRAATLGDAGLQARITIVRADRLAVSGDLERGRDLLLDAALEALEADRPDLAAIAFSSLVSEDGSLRGEQFAAQWQRFAEAMLARLGPVTRYHSHFALNQAFFTQESRDLQATRIAYERVVAIDDETIGHDDPAALSTRARLAHVLLKLGEFDGAVRMLEEILAKQIELLGEVDRDLVITLGVLGDATSAAGRPWDSMRYHDRSLAMAREIYGDRHLGVAIEETNYALTLARFGQPQRALELLDHARTVVLEQGHPSPAHLASIESFRGAAHAAMGDRERACEIWLAMLAADEGGGAHHFGTRLGLGRALRELGRLAEARAQLRIAADLALDVHGPDHAITVSIAIETAMVEIASGGVDLEPLERGLAFDRSTSLAEHAVLVRFYLAKGLVASGGDGTRAVALAVEAHALALAEFPDLAPPILQWLQGAR